MYYSEICQHGSALFPAPVLPPSSFPPLAPPLCFRKQFPAFLLVQLKQIRHPLRIVGKDPAVGFLDRFVQLLVRLRQFRRHGQRVVQVGKAACREQGAGVQYRLSRLFDSRLLLAGGSGPREIVVDNGSGIAVGSVDLKVDVKENT